MKKKTSLDDELLAIIGCDKEYTLNELTDHCYERLPHRSRAYIKTYLQKCTVNNPSRVLLGEGIDLLYKTRKGKYRRITLDYNGEYYSFDKKLSQEVSLIKDQERNDRLQEYRKGFIGNKFKVYPQEKDILVISQCTKSKNEVESVAMDMYEGLHHKLLRDVSSHFDTYIISAGYGLISSKEIIQPYDVTFNNIYRNDLHYLRDILYVREQLDTLIENTNYKLIIFALGDMYLEVLDLKRPFNTEIPIINIGTRKRKGQRNELQAKNVHTIHITHKKLLKLKVPMIASKGALLKKIFETHTEEQIINNPLLFEMI